MCGRFVLISDLADIAERFHAVAMLSQVAPRYNIAPGSVVAAMRSDAPGVRQVIDMHWGMAPAGGSGASQGPGRSIINARSESVDRKPTFREAFRKRRSLVIADGYYEWQNQSGRRVPWYIRRATRDPLLLAALYQWTDPPGGQAPSCAVITRGACEATGFIHDRMPLVIAEHRIDDWLDPSATGAALRTLMHDEPPGDLEYYEVSPRVNRPGYDAPDCIEPAVRRSSRGPARPGSGT